MLMTNVLYHKTIITTTVVYDQYIAEKLILILPLTAHVYVLTDLPSKFASSSF